MSNKTKGASQPIKVKTPSRPKSQKKKKSVSFNLERDGWLATLANPWGVHGIRIPDDVISPSATCTIRQRLTLTGVQDGTTGKYACGVVFFPTVTACYKTSSAYDSTSNNVTFNASADVNNFATFNGLSRMYRVVSAGLGVFSSTAMAQNSGRNLCAFFPGSDYTDPIVTSSAGQQISTFTMLSAENSEDSPLNRQMVCSISWVPTDTSNYLYHRNNAWSSGTFSSQGRYNNGACVWMADGLSATASFEVHLILNLEFLPSTNAISFFTTLPSLYNVAAMERALNSPLVSRMFHTGDPEAIMTVTASNNVGLTSLIGQLVSNFGSGALGALGPVATYLGRSAAYAGLNRVQMAMSNSLPPVRSGLLGLNN